MSSGGCKRLYRALVRREQVAYLLRLLVPGDVLQNVPSTVYYHHRGHDSFLCATQSCRSTTPTCSLFQQTWQDNKDLKCRLVSCSEFFFFFFYSLLNQTHWMFSLICSSMLHPPNSMLWLTECLKGGEEKKDRARWSRNWAVSHRAPSRRPRRTLWCYYNNRHHIHCLSGLLINNGCYSNLTSLARCKHGYFHRRVYIFFSIRVMVLAYSAHIRTGARSRLSQCWVTK